MCVSCSANKCRIRESDLQAACLYIIFLNWYEIFFQTAFALVAALFFHKHHIPHAVPQPLAARFEFGFGAVGRCGRVISGGVL